MKMTSRVILSPTLITNLVSWGVATLEHVKVWDSPAHAMVENTMGSQQPDDGGYLGPSSDLEDIRVDKSSTKHHLMRYVAEYVSTLIESPSILLSHPSPKIASEIRSSISKNMILIFQTNLRKLAGRSYWIWCTTPVEGKHVLKEHVDSLRRINTCSKSMIMPLPLSKITV